MEIIELLATADQETIIHCDETSWWLFPNGLLTWARIGDESIQVKTNRSPRTHLTVHASITAAGTKLPLLCFAHGKTEAVHVTPLGDVAYHWVIHSESGWQTSSTFKFHLTKLRECIGDRPIQLICDLYAAHRTPQVRKCAADLGITLHFIPASLTDELQPLDRRVFGCLKAKAKAIFHLRTMENPFIERTTLEAVQDMVAAWEVLDECTIEEGWAIYDERLESIESGFRSKPS
jgi:hypothetical protein